MPQLILVSDNSPELAEALATAGESLDLTVVAEPPARVVARARKVHPVLIILDIQQSDGLEVLSLLKTGIGTARIPVVVVANDDSTDLREMALEIGADAFVAKPLGPDFLPKVATLLASRGRKE